MLAAPGGRRLAGGLPPALLATGWLVGSVLAMATPYLFVGPIDDYGYAILPGLVGMGIGAGAATLALGLIAARGGLGSAKVVSRDGSARMRHPASGG